MMASNREEDLRKSIEQHRQELQRMVKKRGDLLNKKTIKKSREIDKLLSEYQRMSDKER